MTPDNYRALVIDFKHFACFPHFIHHETVDRQINTVGEKATATTTKVLIKGLIKWLINVTGLDK